MRVLLIHNILWSHYKAVVFNEFAHALREVEGELLVLQTALTASGQQKLSEVDKTIHRYPYELLFPYSWERTTILGRYRSYREGIKVFQPDVVILPGYTDKAIWLLTAHLKWQGIPFIQTCDSTVHDHVRVWYKEKIKTLLLNAAELVYCYGAKQKEYLELLNIPIAKIHTRIQATDNKKFINASSDKLKEVKKEQSALKLLFVGRLSPEKNLPFLLRCIKQVKFPIHLTILGAGPEQERISSLIDTLDLVEKVNLVGSVSWDKVVEHYLQKDLFVLPSTSETWGVVVNEAMLCKLPVLVSNLCGCSGDLIKEGVNGFTFNPYDENDLVFKLEALCSEKENLKAWGERSFEMIQAYSPQIASRQMLKGVNKVLTQ
jgi:glycosyltransferase involved in cell wall biosynthesis